MRLTCGLVLTIVALFGNHAAAARVSFESGSKAVPMVELFSSEGCSSCPPADRWFRSLKSASGLWKQFIPIVFHVDYWDQLGWRDDLATKEFTDRQRAYAREWGNDHIYTPGVVLAGAEWTGWRTSKEPQSNERRNVGNLKLEQLEKGKFMISFSPSGQTLKDPKIFVAILGMGVQHEIGAGENQGTTLSHDFVVLQLQSRPAKNEQGVLRSTIELKSKNSRVNQLAAVAWVSANDSIRAIQAVGGFLEQ